MAVVRRSADSWLKAASPSSIATTATTASATARTRRICAGAATTPPDPWTDYVIAAVGADGGIVSGWNMRNARFPARVAEADSETAYTTDRAIDFIAERGDRPWVLHLSYVKPHWPYIAPAPYHARYTLDQCLAGESRRARARRRASGTGRVSQAGGMRQLHARRSVAGGAAGLPGTHSASRRPSRPRVGRRSTRRDASTTR